MHFFLRGRFGIIWGFLVLCFPVSQFFCFSAILLLCSHCFAAFSSFPAFLLFAFPAFPASLLFLLFRFSAFLLLYFCAFLLLLFYIFFSSVMCFCCYTSCSFASLLPVFTVSLSFSFALFCSVCILNETLERP